MNDLHLIDRHGPAATPLTDDVLDAARQRLAAAAGARRPRRRLPLLAAAAAAAVGLAVAPALLKSDDSIALAAVDPLTFPVTATWLPAGLGDPVVSRDSGHLQFARYGAPGDDHVVVTAANDPDQWEDRHDERPIDIGGRPGTIFTQHPGEVSDVVITWTQADGDLIGVTGRGKYASPDLVEKVAEGVVDRAQPVDLFLTIAPAGWHVMGYQSDHHISYGERGELMVVLTSTQVDPRGGRTGWRDISVDGRPGAILLVEDDDTHNPRAWTLITTAPDGREFFLKAPASLTEAQVIEIAAGVRHR